jgi:hypothetical protein
MIPDKVLAVGPNNELFYFRIEHQSDWGTNLRETYKKEHLKMM